MSATPTVAIEPPTDELLATIGDGLGSFNDAASGRSTDTEEFVVSVRDVHDVMRGGAYCSVGFAALFVKWLWLDDTVRGAGIGRTVMAAGEAEARRRGARMAHLDTFNFQARGFYEKLGYREFGRLDYPIGAITRFYMVKDL